MSDLTIVEVKSYGDFDSLYTDSIWMGYGAIPEYPNAGNETYDGIEKYHKILKRNGFKKIKTKEITFGGNL